MAIISPPPAVLPQRPTGPAPLPTRDDVRRSAVTSVRHLVDWGTLAWRWVALRYLFTAGSVVLSLILVFYLPQTQHVLWQLPGVAAMSGGDALLAFLFYVLILALIGFYVVLMVALTPRPAAGQGWSPSRLGGDGWFLVDPHVPTPATAPGRFSRFAEVLVRGAVRLRSDVRLWLGASLAAAGSALAVLARYYLKSLPAGWGSAGLIVGLGLGLVGAWLVFLPRDADPRQAEPEAAPDLAVRRVGYKLNLCGRALWLVGLTTLLCELLWALPFWFPDFVGFRVYTIAAVIQLVFVLTSTARVVDACHVYSAWNIRVLFAAVLAMVLSMTPSHQVGRFWQLPPRPTQVPPVLNTRAWPGGVAGSVPLLAARGQPGDPFPTIPSMPPPQPQVSIAPAGASAPSVPAAPVLPMDETIQDIWLRAFEARMRAIPPGPVVIVSASGGGARAALFAALVLKGLQDEKPLRAIDARDLPDPARSASLPLPFVPPDDPSPRTLADRVLLISSVSGGSLASAYYLHQNYPHVRAYRDRSESGRREVLAEVKTQSDVRDGWRNSYRSDIYARMRAIALAMLDEARSGRSKPLAASAGPNYLEALEYVAAECERLANSRGQGEPAKIAPWLSTSAFVDDMMTDYMAPLLRGVLLPGVERGESVSRFWEERFGWSNVEDVDLHRKLDPETPPGVALPPTYPNAAPLALLNACDVTRGARVVLGFPPVPPGLITDPLVSPTTQGPYSLTDRGDFYYHVSLAEAVRLSANFPWGFETAELALKRGEDSILVIDGGVVDNSGIDSLSYLLQGLLRQAQEYAAVVRTKQAELARNPDGSVLGAYDLPGTTDMQRRAAALVKELRRRGVVLVQIDSGTKDIQVGGPSIFTLLAQLAPAVFRPVQALNNTSYTNADLAILGHDLALQDVLTPDPDVDPYLPDLPQEPGRVPGPMPAPQAPAQPRAPIEGPLPPAPSATGPPAGGCTETAAPEAAPEPDIQLTPEPPTPAAARAAASPHFTRKFPPLYWRVRLTCNNTQNVMTAWTLGPEDKARVMVQFLIEWSTQRELLARAYHWVDLTALAYGQALNPYGEEHDKYIDTLKFLHEGYRRAQARQTIADRSRAELTRAQERGAPPTPPYPAAPMPVKAPYTVGPYPTAPMPDATPPTELPPAPPAPSTPGREPPLPPAPPAPRSSEVPR